MHVILVNGSPRPRGNTHRALTEIGGQLDREGISWEIFHIGAKPIQDCVGCWKCADREGCVFTNDVVSRFQEKAKTADGFVFGTPVYFAHPTGGLLSFMDRAFFSHRELFTCKPAAAVAVARRAGTSASLDVVNKYFSLCQMPIVSSTYWNLIHGRDIGEADQDAEGLQTMRNLARHMAWMLRCFRLGREQGIPLPQVETGARTNFVR